jgi:S1-C subfamily serine protease
MNRLTVAFLIVAFGAANSETLNEKQIFEKYKDAVVTVFGDGLDRGCGFIVSADGLIYTANHVITTDESGVRKQFSKIEVKGIQDAKSHFANVVGTSEETDTAILKIVGSQKTHVALGEWSEVQESDPVMIITAFAGCHAHSHQDRERQRFAILQPSRLMLARVGLARPIRQAVTVD